MHACPKGGKDRQFKRISTFIATILAGVPRTRPLVNITTCFSAFWEEGAAQAELVYTQKDLDLVEDLGLAAGFTSRRPPRNYPGSRIGEMELKLNCTAKCSDDLSEDGCKPVWTDNTSKGYESGSKT